LLSNVEKSDGTGPDRGPSPAGRSERDTQGSEALQQVASGDGHERFHKYVGQSIGKVL